MEDIELWHLAVFTSERKSDAMASKEYKIRIGGKSYKTMANSAEQAARRVEKLHAKNTRVINQREKGLSNVTRKSVADAPGIAVAAFCLVARYVLVTLAENGVALLSALALKKAQEASARKRRKKG